MSDKLDIQGMVRSGAPVKFEIDGHEFALRQMTPAERDKLNYVELRLRDRIMADYRADGLDKQPISDDMQTMIDLYMAALEQAYKAALEADDQAAAIAVARDMEQAPLNWPTSLAQERANSAVKRADGRWAIDNLLEGDKAKFRELTAPEPLSHDAVKDALEQWRELATFDPNLHTRKQLEPTS